MDVPLFSTAAMRQNGCSIVHYPQGGASHGTVNERPGDPYDNAVSHVGGREDPRVVALYAARPDGGPAARRPALIAERYAEAIILIVRGFGNASPGAQGCLVWSCNPKRDRKAPRVMHDEPKAWIALGSSSPTTGAGSHSAITSQGDQRHSQPESPGHPVVCCTGWAGACGPLRVRYLRPAP
jgi:hypothetical protein